MGLDPRDRETIPHNDPQDDPDPEMAAGTLNRSQEEVGRLQENDPRGDDPRGDDPRGDDP